MRTSIKMSSAKGVVISPWQVSVKMALLVTSCSQPDGRILLREERGRVVIYQASHAMMRGLGSFPPFLTAPVKGSLSEKTWSQWIIDR